MGTHRNLLCTLLSLSSLTCNAGNGCDGTRYIQDSCWFLTCPSRSHACGNRPRNFWGLWKDCCCDKNLSYVPSAAGNWLCKPCHGETNTAAEDKVPLIWWRGLPSPKWLREYFGGIVQFSIVPMLLRTGTLTAIGWASLRFTGVKLTDASSLFAGPREEVYDEPTRLLPGAWAIIKHTGGSVEVERLKDVTIKAYRSAKRAEMVIPGSEIELLSAPIDPPSSIALLPASVKHMCFEEYRLALGYERWFAVLMAVLHLLFWHLLQIFLYSLAFLCSCDTLDRAQLILGGLFCTRQLVYLVGLTLAWWWRPSYLLFHPMAVWKAGGNWYVEMLSYVLQPEMWVVKVAFVNHTPKPVTYFGLLALNFSTDLFAVVALVAGLRSGKLTLALWISYGAGSSSAVLSLFAFCFTDFFVEWVEESSVELLKQLKNAGCLAKDLRKARYTAAELSAAGYSRCDLKVAGCSAKELKAAGHNAVNLKNAGYPAKELVAAGCSWEDLSAAGFSNDILLSAAKDLKGEGFPLSALIGFSSGALAEVGYSEEELKAAGYDIELRRLP